MKFVVSLSFFVKSKILKMNTSEIGALSIGLGIVVFSILLTMSTGTVNNFTSFNKSNLFIVKKWLYISALLIVNILLSVIVFYRRNLQVLLYVIALFKLKNILMAFMFIGGLIYKNALKLINRKKESHDIQMEAIDDFDKILAFVPVYKELEFQVRKTMDSLVENKIGQNYMMICLISDGFSNYTNLLDTILMEKTYYYNSWNGEENIGVKVVYGQYKGTNSVVITKIKNMGQKDSVVLCNDLFNYQRQNLDPWTASFREELNKDLQDNFNSSNHFDYIFTTDADTRLESNVLNSLIHSMKERDAIAGCGVINVEKEVGDSFYWSNLQSFQLMYRQYLRRTNEDLISQVLCLPGCISMFKVQNESNGSLEMYSKLPNDDNLLESSVQYIGTEHRFTSCLIYNQEKFIILNSEIHAYKNPPQSWNSFMNQRKRWCNNMYFNNMLNIVGPNINFLLRFFNVIEFLRMTFIYFRVFNSMYFIFLLASHPFAYNVLDLVPLIVLISLPLFCFFVYSLFNNHLRSNYLTLVVGFLFNKISTFVLNPVIFTTMLWNIGNQK
jgi:cellulose synthase/poly-beta-1,6-N-acetylglucosamine synthase-like glycosyltransferase